MVMSMTGMDIANASLLDEATAAAEGMVLSFSTASSKKRTFFVDQGVSPQTIAVLRTRAKGFGINLVIGDASVALKDDAVRADLCGVLVQYPDVDGSIKDFGALAESVHEAKALLVCATDLLALTMLKPPGEWGADIVVGNSARFGVPSGYGGPHAAFFACTDKLKRKMPGRLIGLSRDTEGKPAYRLALQSTRIFLSRVCDENPNFAFAQRANNIFDVRRRRATSALLKRSLRTWPPCTRFGTVPKGSSISRSACTRSRRF